MGIQLYNLLNSFLLILLIVLCLQTFGEASTNEVENYYKIYEQKKSNQIYHLLNNESNDQFEAEENFGLRHRPMVKQVSPFCTTSIQRLKAGPPNIPQLICDGSQWTDTSFNTSMAIFWSGFTSAVSIAQWNSSNFWWQRWSTSWTNISLFPSNGTIDFRQSIQLMLGDCYWISQMASCAEFPSLIKNALLTQTKNNASIYAVNYYIRGRPWTVAVDDYLYMYNQYGASFKTTQPNYNYPTFGQPSPDKTAIWAAVFEKAWAKVKGNYLNTEGGLNQEAIGALTGVPVLKFNTVVGDLTFFNTLQTADQNQYILAAQTGAGGDQTNNICNISNSHAYSILAAFNISATNNTQIPVLMIRNPWGSCGSACYNGSLNAADAFWTAQMINQLPFGVNPVTDGKNYGIFIVPASNFANCFTNYQIGYYLDNQGYSAAYYDVENASTNIYTFTFQIPSTATNLSPIYFSASTYSQSIVPFSCFNTGTSVSIVQMVVYSQVGTATRRIAGQNYYYQYYPEPVVVSNYVAGTLFTITVQWTWNGNPNPDFTFKVYSKFSGVNILDSNLGTAVLNYNGSSPSGFTNSNYTGMTQTCSPFIGNTTQNNQTNTTSNSTSNSTSNTPSQNSTSDQTAQFQARKQKVLNTKISGLLGAFANSGNLEELILFIWYNPWCLFIIYNFGLW